MGHRLFYCLMLLGLWLAGSASFAVGADLLAERRARVEAMTPDEKQQLQAKAERFNRLSASEQQRLRDLHAALERDPERDALKQTLQRYEQFLLTLPAPERAALSQLTISERVERVQKLLREQQSTPSRFGPRPLSPSDRVVIRQWIERQVLSQLPVERRADWEQTTDEERRKTLARIVLPRFQLPDAQRRTGVAPFAELMKLHDQLSVDARRQITESNEPTQKLMVVTNWVLQALDLAPTEQQLQEFFERDIPLQERQRLLALPAEEMQRELRRLYMRWALRETAGSFDVMGRGGPRPNNGPLVDPQRMQKDRNRPPNGPLPPKGDRPAGK